MHQVLWRAAAGAALACVAACSSDVSTSAGLVQPPNLISSQVATVTVTPEGATLVTGDTLRLAATTREASGTIVTGRVVTWTSAAPDLVSVSSSGLLTARAAGNVVITATSEGRTGRTTITVAR